MSTTLSDQKGISHVIARREILLFFGATLVLFFFSAFRHWSFRSSAFDLGIFDQALWQLSVGETPIVSLIGRHILSDHGAFILYPLSTLYKFFASPYLLLFLQSTMLASGIFPLFALARYYSLPSLFSWIAGCTYLFHPVIFNVNLFDFHPEVIGVPLFPLLFLYAEQRRYFLYALVAILFMSCKEVLSLTVAALGVYYLLRKRISLGLCTLLFGLLWFIIVTQYIMPGVPGGTRGAAFDRYAYLGTSLPEMITTLFFSPSVVLSHVHWYKVGKYLLGLFLPCFWVLHRRSLSLFVVLFPTLALNILSTQGLQLSLRFQYSLPLIPILGVMTILRWSDCTAPTCPTHTKWLWFKPSFFPHCFPHWSVAAFLIPFIIGNLRFPGLYPINWFSVGDKKALRSTIAQIPKNASLYASARLIPHLSHRVQLQLIDGNEQSIPLSRFEYVATDNTHSENELHNRFNAKIRRRLLVLDSFEMLVDTPEVSLFKRRDKK